MANPNIVKAEAELKADPSLKIAATGKAIVKARNTGLRWERLAVYSGLSVAKVKALFQEESGIDPKDSYTGRGRNFSATPAAKKATPAKGKAAPAKPAGKKPIRLAGKGRASRPSKTA